MQTTEEKPLNIIQYTAGSLLIITLLILSFISSNVLAAAPAADWHRTAWQGEKAWKSTSSGWTAIVSEERSRLVSLAESDHGENLLYVSTKAAVSWGGHRCWLGPQSKWKKGWPPSDDWEASAAAHVKAAGSLLTITHPHSDSSYPRLIRSYQWRRGVLHCNLIWQGGCHHAIHILQVPRWSVIHLQRAISKAFPLGYGMPPVFGPVETLDDVAIKPDVGRADGDRMELRHANLAEKIAVAPQELTADIGNYQLKMRPGAVSGVTAAAPDHGLLTQVFVGDLENSFIELEQLSRYVKDGRAASEILIEPSRK